MGEHFPYKRGKGTHFSQKSLPEKVKRKGKGKITLLGIA